MTTRTKTLIATALLLAVGSACQIRRLSDQRDQSHLLMEKTRALELESRQIREQHQQTLAALSATQAEVESVRRQTKYASEDSELGVWLGRVNRLKQWLHADPKKEIPEMQFLTSNEWLSVTLDNPVDTNARIRDALSKLRAIAKMKPQVAPNLSNAVQAYGIANKGLLPTDLGQLKPFLKHSISDDILQRYEVVPESVSKSAVTGIKRDRLGNFEITRIVLQEKSQVDKDYDTKITISDKGDSNIQGISQLGNTVNRATRAYAKANNGQTASSPEQLLPYLPTPVEPIRLKEYWDVSRH